MKIVCIFLVFASVVVYPADSVAANLFKAAVETKEQQQLLPSESEIPSRVRRQGQSYYSQHNPQPYHTQFSQQYHPPAQQNEYHHVGSGADGNSGVDSGADANGGVDSGADANGEKSYNENLGNAGSSQYSSKQRNAYGSEGGDDAGNSGGSQDESNDDDGHSEGSDGSQGNSEGSDDGSHGHTEGDTDHDSYGEGNDNYDGDGGHDEGDDGNEH